MEININLLPVAVLIDICTAQISCLIDPDEEEYYIEAEVQSIVDYIVDERGLGEVSHIPITLLGFFYNKRNLDINQGILFADLI